MQALATWNDSICTTLGPMQHTRESWSRFLAPAGGALIGLLAISPLRVPSLVDRLVAAPLPAKRTLEPRISGGFGWRPVGRDVVPRTNATARQQAVAAEILEAQTTKSPSPHAVALAALVLGRPREAMDTLLPIVGASNDAHVWNDAAAAYIARAVEIDDPVLLTEALSAADVALEIEPVQAEALFNRALALERLGLCKPALAAWYRVLRNGVDDEWSREAREHVNQLKANADPQFEPAFVQASARIVDSGDASEAEALVERAPRLVRGRLQRYELTEWANLLPADAQLADRKLRIVRVYANALARHGDPFLLRYVEAIDGAGESQRKALAAAQRLFAEGTSLIEEKPTAAEALIRDSARLFERAFQPMALSARRNLAASLYGRNRIDEARRELLAFLPLIPAEFPVLRAETLWQLGLCEAAQTNWDETIRAFQEAARLFERAGDRYNVAVAQHILSEVYDTIGEPEAAWRLRFQALRELGKTSMQRTQSVVSAISRHWMGQRQWRVALSFIDIETQLAPRFDDVRADLLLRRATTNHFLGRASDAESDLVEAKRVIDAMVDEGLQTRAQADELAVAALLSSTPAEAVARLTTAIDFHAAHGRRMYLPNLYLERGRALRAVGDSVRARRDFESGIAGLEATRETLEDPGMRIGVFEDAEELFTEAIEEALRRGQEGEAFDLAERARARVLLDRLAITAAGSLEAGTAIVEPVALQDRLVLFVKTGDGVRTVTSPTSAVAIAGEAHRLRVALKTGVMPEAYRASRSLYSALIAPIESLLTGRTHVVFIPDPATSEVPFGALKNAVGQYLLEQYVIHVAPSAAVFLRTKRIPGPPRNVLVVAPSGNGEPLDWTSLEADTVASSYPSAFKLEGEAATPTAVLSAAPSADAIHFAGHGLSRGHGSRTTALLLSGSGTQLETQEIERLDLHRCRYVVLAACDTATGESRWSEGTLSVARSFLAAGTPSVIATLWDIDDDAKAVDFFSHLHHRLAAGTEPADALQATQFECIRQRRSCTAAIWASVQVVGR